MGYISNMIEGVMAVLECSMTDDTRSASRE